MESFCVADVAQRYHSGGSDGGASHASVAVLPFLKPMIAENEYFSDGLTEELIRALPEYPDCR